MSLPAVIRLAVATLLLGAAARGASAQVAERPRPQPPPPSAASADTSKPVVIDYAQVYERTVTDTAVRQRLVGEVELRQDSVFIYCDEATIVGDDFVMARGNVVVRQNDTISVFADSLEYFADVEVADLFGNVVLVNGRQQLFTDTLRYDLARKLASYRSRAKLTDGEAQLSSLRGTYDVEAEFATFKDSVFVVRPDFNLLADTLSFATGTRVVYFDGPTAMATPQSRVYCEDGFYRLADTTGRFSVNAQVARGTQRATADTIYYYGDRDLFVLAGDARFRDGTRRARGRRIEYREQLNETVLTGDAVFEEEGKRVVGERIRYDGATRRFASQGRVRISEPPYVLVADSLDFDDATGMALVRGNVVWRDTATRRSIEAQRVDYLRAGDYVKAYGGRPVFATELEGDTLWLAADTLLTFQRPRLAVVDTAGALDTLGVRPDSLLRFGDSLRGFGDSLVVARDRIEGLRGSELQDTLSQVVRGTPQRTLAADTLLAGLPDSLTARPAFTLPPAPAPAGLPDSVRMLLAYPRVRIFKRDFQAVSDSLSYDGGDSTFTLFREPVLWSDTSQFVADTVVMRLRGDAISAVRLRSRAFITSTPDELFYNQVKGRRVDVGFVAGAIDRMTVRGNAESVYYILDEGGAYVGVNHVRAARMRMRFEDEQLSDIYFYDEPEGEITPLRPVGQEPKLLDDFSWETEARPRSRDDL